MSFVAWLFFWKFDFCTWKSHYGENKMVIPAELSFLDTSWCLSMCQHHSSRWFFNQVANFRPCMSLFWHSPCHSWQIHFWKHVLSKLFSTSCHFMGTINMPLAFEDLCFTEAQFRAKSPTRLQVWVKWWGGLVQNGFDIQQKMVNLNFFCMHCRTFWRTKGMTNLPVENLLAAIVSLHVSKPSSVTVSYGPAPSTASQGLSSPTVTLNVPPPVLHRRVKSNQVSLNGGMRTPCKGGNGK